MVDTNKDGIHDDRGYNQPVQVSRYADLHKCHFVCWLFFKVLSECSCILIKEPLRSYIPRHFWPIRDVDVLTWL